MISGSSPSSRRAWIEIETERNADDHLRVALLAEGVDRNDDTEYTEIDLSGSPSSRRAWIEMLA